MERARAQSPTPGLAILGYTNGQVRLQSTTALPSETRFEGSFDLGNWFFIRSLPPSPEKVEIVHSNTPPASDMFFRARPGSPPEPIRIGAQLDPKLTTVALLTPEEGGQMTVTSREGVRFDFVADTNTVFEPVAIRMTVITNFSSFPAHDGFRAAVAFEPDGLEFRRSGKLTITFPATIPVPDMLGYSFDGDGSGFHLTPSRPSSNAVEVAISHFSGVGVARFSSSKPPTYLDVWRAENIAMNAANDHAARSISQVIKDRESGRITKQEADRRLKNIELRRVSEFYDNGVRPFLDSMTKECRWKQAEVYLENLSSAIREVVDYGSERDPFQQKLAEIMPAARCNCAHELIRRCESDPKASGSVLFSELKLLLGTARDATGRTDAQGCDLGSDEAILDRMRSSPCLSSWAGTITLSIIQTKQGEIIDTDSAGKLRSKSTWDLKEALVYSGQVTEAGDPLVVGKDEVWAMKTAGRYVAVTRRKDVTTRIGGDTTETKTISHDAGTEFLGNGQLNLFMSNGKFDNVSGFADVAVTNGGPVLRYTELDVTTIRCEDSYFASDPNRVCRNGSFSENTLILGLIRLFGVKHDSSPPPTVSLDEKSFSLNWVKKTTNTVTSPPLITVERVEIDLVKKKR